MTIKASVVASVTACVLVASCSNDAHNEAENTAANACRMAGEFVKERLKAPTTADFSDCTAFREVGGAWEVKGNVDAQNSFGAKLRTTYFVRLEWVTGKRWRASSVVLNSL